MNSECNRKGKNALSKKIAVVFLIMAMLLSVACSDTTASVMRLTATIGEVAVKDDKDALVEPESGMRLFDGNSVSTESDSFAYISLDDTKALKLDSLSKASLGKNGNKLEVLVLEGGLFFNVTAPLEDDELLTIKTSTMATSIRGTSGYIAVESGELSQFTLFTGEVEVTATDDTGAETSVILKPGQTASAVTGEVGTEIEITETDYETLPEFAISAVTQDEELLEEAKESTGVDFSHIVVDDEDDDENEDIDDDLDEDDKDESDENDDLDEEDDADDGEDENEEADDLNDDYDDVETEFDEQDEADADSDENDDYEPPETEDATEDEADEVEAPDIEESSEEEIPEPEEPEEEPTETEGDSEEDTSQAEEEPEDETSDNEENSEEDEEEPETEEDESDEE